MTAPEFQPGCRLSTLDVSVLIVATIGAAIVVPFVWWMGVVILFVFGHFYLFCNVFRLSRLPELIWAALFLILAIGTLLAEWPGWLATFLVAGFTTPILIALEMRQPYYHGLWWEAVNPRLPQWWEEKEGNRQIAEGSDKG